MQIYRPGMGRLNSQPSGGKKSEGATAPPDADIGEAPKRTEEPADGQKQRDAGGGGRGGRKGYLRAKREAKEAAEQKE